LSLANKDSLQDKIVLYTRIIAEKIVPVTRRPDEHAPALDGNV
jgi:hypothetical protein